MRRLPIVLVLASCTGTHTPESAEVPPPGNPPEAPRPPVMNPPGPPVDISANPPAPDKLPPDVITGGITPTEVDADAIAAFDNVLPLLRKEHHDDTIAVVKIKTHALQVVAGLNHTWDVDVSTKDGPKSLHIVAYQDLQQHWSISEETGW